MADFTLPFQQSTTKFNGDATAFEVNCESASTAIAGKVNQGLSIGVYGEVGGPFPARGLEQINLLGGVVGATNLNLANGVVGASQSGIGVKGISDSSAGVHGESSSGVGVLATSQTQDAINGTSSAPGHAGVSANNNNGGYGLWAKSWGTMPGTGGIAGYFNSDGNNAIQAISTAEKFDAIVAQSSSSAHAAVSAQNPNGGFGVWASSPNGIAIYGQGKIAGHFEGKMEVIGDHHCTGTLSVDVDVVLKGADFAEDFAVKTSECVEPGMVMVLDEIGVLRPCDKSYDRKVAGVISGAGDYKPGLILDRQNSSEGRLPLALVGKVYCNVDATCGAIEVGDLLTTSPTPGHAMKASDPSRSFGAVIGKALRPLTSGKELVPILIGLQ